MNYKFLIKYKLIDLEEICFENKYFDEIQLKFRKTIIKTTIHSPFSLDEITLIDVGLCNDSGKILLRPVLSGHILLKYHHFLKAHFFKLL